MIDHEREPESLDELAGAYVLGTLSAAERDHVAQRLHTDPQMELLVQAWERRLLPLASAVPPVVPPARVWQGIAAHIDAPLGARTLRAHRFGAAFWRAASALTLGLALGVGTMTWVQRDDRVPESYVGFLATPNDARPHMHASAKRKERALFIKMIKPVELAPGQQLVLWGLPADTPPRRIGIVPATGQGRLTLESAADLVFKDIAVLAVSSEPIGTPATQPTGDFILRGPCVKLW